MKRPAGRLPHEGERDAEGPHESHQSDRKRVRLQERLPIREDHLVRSRMVLNLKASTGVVCLHPR